MRRSEAWRRRLSEPGVVLALSLFLLLVATNLSRLRKPIKEAADFAANSMLMDRAEHLRQLTGNYSRVKFHHPGPAFLYVGAFGQAVFHQLLHLVPADFNGQLIAFFALNAALAGLVLTTLRRHVPSTAACVAGVVTVLVWELHHLALSVPWPPYLYVLPFLLLAVTAPSLVLGELRDLPAYVLAAGLLVHGHVSFLLFVAVTTAAVMVGWALVNAGHRQEQLVAARRRLQVAGAVLFVFLLPMVLDVVLHWPGQWSLYWHYSRTATSNPVHGVLDYVGHFWTGTTLGWVAFVVAAGVWVALGWRTARAERRYLVALAGFLGLLLALVFLYAYRGVDDLSQIYTGDFSTVIPGVVLGVAVLLVVQRLETAAAGASAPARHGVAVAAGVLGAVLLVTASGATVRLAVYPRVTGDLAALTSMVKPGQAVILDFPSGSTWPKALAVLEQAHREHLPICVAQPQWSFMVSPAVECTPEQRATGRHVKALYVGPEVKRLTTVIWSRGRLQYTPE